MKKLPVLLIAVSAIALINACSKSYTNGVDNTVGITNTSRLWADTAWGNVEDTTINIWDSTVTKTAKPYHRKNDTTFAVMKYDTYAVTIFGTLLRYRATDSTAKTVTFDTLFAAEGNTNKTVLIYYYAKDSMTYEYHKIKSLNSYSGHYIEDHMKLRTKKN